MIGDGTGYTSIWRVHRVDTVTWADTSETIEVESAQIVTSDDGTLQSGSMVVCLPTESEFEEGYYRLSMISDGGRVDVATMLCKSSTGNVDRRRVECSVTGYSVLEPANKKKLFSGEYAPAGSDGAKFVADMLSECVNAPISVSGSFTLLNHVVFDTGASVLDAARMVLDAGNFVMQISGYGEIVIRESGGDAVLVVDNTNARLLQPGTDYSQTDRVPNRYIAIDGEQVAIAENNDPNSITSTVNVGYLDDEIDESPTRVNGETLQAYADRRLSELSIITDERTYNREYVGGVFPGDIVRYRIPYDGLSGDMRVTKQEITCGRGVIVRETVKSEVRTWTR